MNKRSFETLLLEQTSKKQKFDSVSSSSSISNNYFCTDLIDQHMRQQAPTWLAWLQEECNFNLTMIGWFVAFLGSLFQFPKTESKFMPQPVMAIATETNEARDIINLLLDCGIHVVRIQHHLKNYPFKLSQFVVYDIEQAPVLCIIEGQDTICLGDFTSMIYCEWMSIQIRLQRARNVKWNSPLLILINSQHQPVHWDDFMCRTVLFRVKTLKTSDISNKLQNLQQEACKMVQICKTVYDCFLSNTRVESIFKHIPIQLGPMFEVQREIEDAQTGLLKDIIQYVIMPYLDERSPYKWINPVEIFTDH
jgi:hypothetical protein